MMITPLILITLLLLINSLTPTPTPSKDTFGPTLSIIHDIINTDDTRLTIILTFTCDAFATGYASGAVGGFAFLAAKAFYF